MRALVEFFCPEHGVVARTNPVSLVECRCGKECAPEGVDPKEHRRNYLALRRQRRKRDRGTL